MQVTVEKITPSKAKEWLAVNTGNRPVRGHHVDRLAEDMSKNRWNTDGAPFRFDTNGSLRDGQHRCHAIVKSGVTITAPVVRGLTPESFTTMDTGARRTTADALHIKNEMNSVTLASALGCLVDYLTHGVIGQKAQTPTTQELIYALDAAPALRQSVRLVCCNKGERARRSGTASMLLAPGLLSALHYLFSEKDSALADEFVNGITTGFNGRPVFHLLRERLIANATNKAKLPKFVLAALAIKAWNGERNKSGTRQLKFNEGEQFPTIE